MTIEFLDFVKKYEAGKLTACKVRIKITKDDGKILDVWNPLDDATLTSVDKDGLTNATLEATAVSMLFNDYNNQIMNGTLVKATAQDLASLSINVNAVENSYNQLINNPPVIIGI